MNESAEEALVQKFGGVKVKNLTLVDGKAVLLPSKAVADLARQHGVLRIDDDVEVFALARSIKIDAVKSQPAEVLPWGIDKIDAEKVWGTATADPIRVAIVNTGIDVKHPDLKDNLKGGVSTVYNIIALPLAAGILASKEILLQPALVAVFVSLSTVIMAINALLLRKRKI